MSKILKTLKRKARNLLYAIPFGMKAGDELMATSNPTDTSEGTTIQQKIQARNVYEALLQGEVTQEVEELRYGMYKAEEESLKYKYLGNGQAIKEEEEPEEVKVQKRKHFKQPNLSLEYSVKEGEKMAAEGDLDPKERKLFEIKYNNPDMRFRYESHCETVEVDNNEEGIFTKFYIPEIVGDRKRRPFINALKKVMDETKDNPITNAYREHNEVCDGIEEFKFSTYKASNNLPNGMEYIFKKGKFMSVEQICEFIVVTYKWQECVGEKLMSEKYYSESQDKKYQNKEKKENYKPTVQIASV